MSAACPLPPSGTLFALSSQAPPIPPPAHTHQPTPGDAATAVARLLAPSGTLVSYGAMSQQPLTIPPGLLIFRDLRVRGFWLTGGYAKVSAWVYVCGGVSVGVGVQVSVWVCVRVWAWLCVHARCAGVACVHAYVARSTPPPSPPSAPLPAPPSDARRLARQGAAGG